MSITEKQELFAQTYVKTGNASEAYRTAYPGSKKWKDNSVYCNASKMLADTKVSQRVKELQKELQKSHNITKDRLIKRLEDIIYKQEELGVDKIDLPAMNKAIETINKMLGFNEPDKIEGELTVKSSLKYFYKDINEND